jgi:hypothetical protein
MQERIFTLKKGTEVADRFDGVTVPFQVPTTLAELITAAGGTKDDAAAVASIETRVSEAARKNVVAVFNQAHALNVQKHVKSGAMEEAATVESLRKDAAEFKYGQVRVRGAATGGTAKPSAAKVTAALGDDFLSTLTPEQRKLYDAKMAALNVKPAAKPAENGTPATSAAPAATTRKK